MNLNWADVVLFYTFTAIVAGGSAYCGTYLKNKGKNLATREDLEGIVTEVRAVTKTAEEIKADIGNDVWSRQRQWELKQEVLFEATRRVAAVFEALKALENILQTEIKNPAIKNDLWTQMTVDENAKWFKTTAALSESKLFVSLTCGKDVLEAIEKFSHVTTTIATKISRDDGAIFRQSAQELFALQDKIRDTIRKELKIDAPTRSQSNEFSGGPFPIAPNPAAK
jgi:hypothetical protein